MESLQVSDSLSDVSGKRITVADDNVNTRRTAARWIGGGLGLAGISIALTIGLDDTHLSSYQLSVWDLAVKSVGGLALFGGIFKYFHQRRDQLAWDKTRFIVDLFKEFDRSTEYRRARRLVDEATDSGDDAYLRTLTGPIADLVATTRADRESLDRYLDFFDRLYTYVFITRTLSPQDVSSFWGYAIDIAHRPPLWDFALAWGYEDVLRLAESFDEAASAREQLIDRLDQEEESTVG